MAVKGFRLLAASLQHGGIVSTSPLLWRRRRHLQQIISEEQIRCDAEGLKTQQRRASALAKRSVQIVFNFVPLLARRLLHS
ncbi:hypothetical protein KC341_g21 [Hortaea werneckii]|nr:hypothetical protein KC341_g21 [Hortaea werneckii]